MASGLIKYNVISKLTITTTKLNVYWFVVGIFMLPSRWFGPLVVYFSFSSTSF